jgi:APA family basic amino acid/polyamine antiporter
MMAFLPLDTWIRLIAWMMIGFDIYLSFGIRRSHLATTDTAHDKRRSIRVTSNCGLALCVVLAVVTFLHHHMNPEQSALIIFAVCMCVFHIIYYLYYRQVRIRKYTGS